MQCQACGAENPSGARFCEQCGVAMGSALYSLWRVGQAGRQVLRGLWAASGNTCAPSV